MAELGRKDVAIRFSYRHSARILLGNLGHRRWELLVNCRLGCARCTSRPMKRAFSSYITKTPPKHCQERCQKYIYPTGGCTSRYTIVYGALLAPHPDESWKQIYARKSCPAEVSKVYIYTPGRCTYSYINMHGVVSAPLLLSQTNRKVIYARKQCRSKCQKYIYNHLDDVHKKLH